MTNKESFASDNYAPVHPKVLESMARVNRGFDRSYGYDKESEALNENIEEVFGVGQSAFLVATGTGANVIALQSVTERHEAVLASGFAHVVVDEGGAPERFGCKIYPLMTVDDKITAESIAKQAFGFGDQHRAQPGVLSITQANEMGRVYTTNELSKLTITAKNFGMRTHLDGARLANSIVAMKSSAKEMISGFDVISLGLSKTGGMVSEAVITNDPIVKEKLIYGRKASTQLMSKLRYMSAQFNALLENDLWLENAQQANEMALYLFEKLEGLPKIEIIRKPEANAIFLKVDSKKIEQIADELGFYIWDRESNLVRFMTSWCSTREGVDSFVEEFSKALKN